MRRHNTDDPAESKRIARQMFANRQIEKWCKWSFEVRGKILWKELMEIIDTYGKNNSI